MPKTDLVKINDRGYTRVPLNMHDSEMYTVGFVNRMAPIMELLEEGYQYQLTKDAPLQVVIFGKDALDDLHDVGEPVRHFEVNSHYKNPQAPILLHIDVDTDSVLLYSSVRNEFALRKIYHHPKKEDIFFWYGKVKYFGSEFMEHSRYEN